MDKSHGHSNTLKHCAGPIPVFGKSPLQASTILLLTLFFFLASFAGSAVHAQDPSPLKLTTGDIWRYFKGAKAPSDNWVSSDFDDSDWMRGPSGFGYGPGSYMTFLHDMQGTYKRVYVRREFTVANPFSVTRMSLSVECDASFAAYINGIEVIRNDVPLHEEFDISGFIHELHAGRNIIAIRCDNDDRESSSFSFNPVFEVSYE